ncbi:hypothetical protein [Stenotrophomonas maltophilia]|uniref:hypothetical protein n=1 Tax=Stenotrophomonas maltophilia TaxID=40324 RepID=UPI0013D9A7C0|nr:hypothetical protein [Stenotrophomonas maltophilia]
MPINTSSLVLSDDLQLPAGAILYSGDAWHLRVHLEENGRKYEGTVALTGAKPGEYRHLDFSSTCLAIPLGVRLESRVIGEIAGPGIAPHGSLLWGRNGVSLVGFVRRAFLVHLNGLESEDRVSEKDFYAKQWGFWVVDGNGQDVGEGPLFTVNIP